MQNKPNFPDIPMNVSDAITMIYEIFPTCRAQKTNPIQTQLKPKQSQFKPNCRKAQINVSIFSEMAYENIQNWTLGENKPKQTQSPPDFFVDSIVQRVYNYVVVLLVIW